MFVSKLFAILRNQPATCLSTKINFETQNVDDFAHEHHLPQA